MTSSEHPAAGHDLVKAVRYWLQKEEENQELKSRVASSLDEIKEFIRQHRSGLEKRRIKLIQTNAYKDETRSMAAALANIQQLVEGGRNISRIFAEIGNYLDLYGGDETFSGALIRVQLADARDEYMCAFQDLIRGTRLAAVLDILYFMPYSFWHSRAVETRNFRSPSAAEVLKLLEELGQRGVDIDSVDPVQLAAIIRIKLGITPRMDYHRMSANKLAERLTGSATVSRHTAKELPLDLGFCSTTEGILANIRRWSAECFGSTQVPVPAEIEAEMVQIVYLSADTIRISGTENERAADFLWLLATVIASDHAVLKDVLTNLYDNKIGLQSVRERLIAAKNYLDEIAVLADGLLLARWSETKNELDSLAVHTDTIAFKSTHENGEFDELEQLKRKRAEVVKALIKITEALQLVEPALCELLTSSRVPAMRPAVSEYLRVLEPAKLRERNYTYSEETKGIARHELAKLRLLIGRMGEIGRSRSADSAGQSAQARAPAGARKTADGSEIGGIPTVDLQEKLRSSLVKAALSVRELKDKVEGQRRRGTKSEIPLALNQLCGKIRMAIETCDNNNLDSIDATQAPTVAESIVPALRDIMTAQTSVTMRVKNAKLTPAEKQPLIALTNTIKMRLGEDLRDLDLVRLELIERTTTSETGPNDVTDYAETAVVAETGEIAPGVDGRQGVTAAIANLAQEDAKKVVAFKEMADCAAAANDALKPVKRLIARLSGAISSHKLDSRELLAATADLKDAIAEAHNAVVGNYAQTEALAANYPQMGDEYREKFDRWHDQLSILNVETERLTNITAAAVALEDAVTTATALEKGIADTLRPLSGKKVRVEVLVPIRERCVQSLATIAQHLKQIQDTREAFTAATKAEWRILKTASEYLERRGSDLEAFETELRNRHSRIEKLHNLVLR